MKQNLLIAFVASMCLESLAIEDMRDEKSPVVRTFGYSLATINPISTDTNLAVDARASFDLGASYELPVYTQAQYYIARQRVKLFLGGRNEFSLTAWLLRFQFYLDIWPAKFTFENYFSYDLLGSSGASCFAGFRYTDITRVQLYLQVDYQDCALGILGLTLPSETGSTRANCEW